MQRPRGGNGEGNGGWHSVDWSSPYFSATMPPSPTPSCMFSAFCPLSLSPPTMRKGLLGRLAAGRTYIALYESTRHRQRPGGSGCVSAYLLYNKNTCLANYSLSTSNACLGTWGPPTHQRRDLGCARTFESRYIETGRQRHSTSCACFGGRRPYGKTEWQA